jgi:hypothetical protein
MSVDRHNTLSRGRKGRRKGRWVCQVNTVNEEDSEQGRVSSAIALCCLCSCSQRGSGLPEIKEAVGVGSDRVFGRVVRVFFGLCVWRVGFPPCLVRPGRRLPVQGLSEGSLGCRDRLPAERGPGTGLKLCHQCYQKSKRNLVYGIWSQ